MITFISHRVHSNTFSSPTGSQTEQRVEGIKGENQDVNSL